MTIQKKRVRASTRSERAVATQLGGRRVFASGSGLDKGDGRVPGVYRIENKVTQKPKYALHVRDWSILWDTAMKDSEQPVFHIKFLDTAHELVVVEENLYSQLGLPEVLRRIQSNGSTMRRSHAISSGYDHLPYGFTLRVRLLNRVIDFPLVVMRYDVFLSAQEALR